MKNGRYSDAQIVGILKQAEGGFPVSELCREHVMVISPFLMGHSRRIHAAVFSFMACVMPPIPMLCRSLL